MTWDERYRAGDFPAELSPFVIAAVRDLPPGRALDLACGAGRHAHWLAERGWEVVAIDNSEEALQRVRVPKLRLDLEREPLPFPDASFDLVLIVRFLHRPLFAEAGRVLRPGGMLVVEVNATGRFGMSQEELERRFAGWEPICPSPPPRGGEGGRRPDEGAPHPALRATLSPLSRGEGINVPTPASALAVRRRG